MNVVIDSICAACVNEKCNDHQRKKIIQDKVTGLNIEARCICKNHKES